MFTEYLIQTQNFALALLLPKAIAIRSAALLLPVADHLK